MERRKRRPLTEQAQDTIREILRPGEIAIDATAGNGHDTVFLAEQVGPSGTVFAFDIQPDALGRTAKRLADSGLENAILLNHDHAHLSAHISNEHKGRIAAVMFNLGYLPGGDKRVMTNSDSTRSAVRQAADFLRPGGVLTIVAYTGHDGGTAEAGAVAELLAELPGSEFEVTTVESQPGRTSGPQLFVVKRRLS